jgi:hypothetical protein
MATSNGIAPGPDGQDDSYRAVVFDLASLSSMSRRVCG